MRVKDDLYRTRKIWAQMIYRCTNPKSDRFYTYGGRGISVCDRWQDFDNFLVDVGIIEKGMSIDRIDLDGDYESINVRVIPMSEQARNKTNTYWVTYNGETKNLADWVTDTGINRGTLRARLEKGWDLDRVFEAPKKEEAELLTYKGEAKTAHAWAKQLGIGSGVIPHRLANGWSIEKALETPVRAMSKHYLEFDAQLKTIPEWEDVYGLGKGTIKSRLSYGWDVERAITTPSKYHISRVTFNGRTMTLSEWAKEYGLAPSTLNNRVNIRKWDFEKALATPPLNPGEKLSDRVD